MSQSDLQTNRIISVVGASTSRLKSSRIRPAEVSQCGAGTIQVMRTSSRTTRSPAARAAPPLPDELPVPARDHTTCGVRGGVGSRGPGLRSGRAGSRNQETTLPPGTTDARRARFPRLSLPGSFPESCRRHGHAARRAAWAVPHRPLQNAHESGLAAGFWIGDHEPQEGGSFFYKKS